MRAGGTAMHRAFVRTCVAAGIVALVFAARPSAKNPKQDFGAFVADQLRAHSEQLFGFHPREEGASGPCDGPSLNALGRAPGLSVRLLSSAVHLSADQIAMYPDDDHPTHLFVCDEESSNPAVQRVALSRPAGSNATTI